MLSYKALGSAAVVILVLFGIAAVWLMIERQALRRSKK